MTDEDAIADVTRESDRKGTDLRMLSVVYSEAELHGLIVCSRDGVVLLRHPEVDGYVVQLTVPFHARVLIDLDLDRMIRTESGEALVRKLISDAAHEYKIALYRKAKAYVEAHARELL